MTRLLVLVILAAAAAARTRRARPAHGARSRRHCARSSPARASPTRRPAGATRCGSRDARSRTRRPRRLRRATSTRCRAPIDRVGRRDFEIVIRVDRSAERDRARRTGSPSALHDPQLVGGAPISVHVRRDRSAAKPPYDYDLRAASGGRRACAMFVARTPSLRASRVQSSVGERGVRRGRGSFRVSDRSARGAPSRSTRPASAAPTSAARSRRRSSSRPAAATAR